jgi:hypothetical protein
MGATTQTRTPLHAMSDEQLRFYAEDELAPAWKREIVERILGERGVVIGEGEHSKIVESLAAYHA